MKKKYFCACRNSKIKEKICLDCCSSSTEDVMQEEEVQASRMT